MSHPNCRTGFLRQCKFKDPCYHARFSLFQVVSAAAMKDQNSCVSLACTKHLGKLSKDPFINDGNIDGIPTKPLWQNASPYSYETIEEISNFILCRTHHRPKIGIICGSGLGSLADLILEPTIVSYDEIPHFPSSTVPGHAGRIVIGLLDGIPVIALQGRLHLYEGYPLWLCAMPVRVMKLIGVQQIIVTCAAGGLNPVYRTGDIMIIKDHINLQGLVGNSALVGEHDERFGPRFFPTNKTYDFQYRQIAKRVAADLGIAETVQEGVHVMVGGPNYETVAELRFLRMVGVDSVGMSTIHEVLVARQCGMSVFAFCLITNECVTEYDCHLEANHDEVLETAEQRQETLKTFVKCMIKEIAEKESSSNQTGDSNSIPESGYIKCNNIVSNV